MPAQLRGLKTRAMVLFTTLALAFTGVASFAVPKAAATATWAPYLSALPTTPNYITAGPDGSGGQTTWVEYNAYQPYSWCGSATQYGNFPTVAYWKNGQWNPLQLPTTLTSSCYTDMGGQMSGGLMVGPNGNIWAAESVYTRNNNYPSDVGWIIYQWSWSSNSWSEVASRYLCQPGYCYGGVNSWAPVSLEPGPNHTALVTTSALPGQSETQSYATSYAQIYEVSASGGVSTIPDVPDANQYSYVTLQSATLGPDGNVWAVGADGYNTGTSALHEWNGSSWGTVASLPVTTYQRLMNGHYYTEDYFNDSNMLWGPDGRLWLPAIQVAASGSAEYMTEEWSGSGNFTSVVASPSGAFYNSGSAETIPMGIGPNGQMLEAVGTQLYTLQGAPALPASSPLSMTLQGNWTTWGQVPATISLNGAALAAQGYDVNAQDWGDITYQVQDLSPDGNVFNTQQVPGSLSSETSLPTQFGHSYWIAPSAQYLDPSDPALALGSVSGAGSNYFLPSNTPGSVQVSAVTSTSITVDWPTLWKSPNQKMVAYLELDSTLQKGTFAPLQQSSQIAYPTHTYTFSGLSPDVKYAVTIGPVEPSGGASFNSAWWGITTDAAPSGTLMINGGTKVTSSPNVTLSVTAQGTRTPPVAVRFSKDNVNWGVWQSLSGTPLSGSPAEGAQGVTGDYYAANTSLAANETTNPNSDYGHFDHFMYQETDPQINFPYGAWPGGSTGIAPQAILNSGSPTNTGADWSAIWNGYLYAPVSGTYSLAVPSDDGATLTVAGRELVDNYNVQGMPAPSAESGTIALTAGQWYPFEIQYSQAWGGAGVLFEWQQPPTQTTPNPTYVPIPAQDLWSLNPSYSTPSGTVQATGTFSWQFPLGSSGTQTVYAQVLSLDGTVSPTFASQILELVNTTPPIIDVTLNGGQSTTTSTTVPVSLSVQGSGLPSQGQMQFQVDGGAWSTLVPFATTTTVTIPSTAGVHTITVQVVDSNGLKSQASQQITYQTSQPSQQTGGSGSVITVANGQAITLNGNTVMTVPAEQIQATFSPPAGPGGSLPTLLSATHDGITWSSWLPYVGTMPITLFLHEVNTLGVQFKYQDTSLSPIYLLPVLPLTTPPTVQATWQGNVIGTTTGAMTAVITVSDDALPVTSLQYSVNGGSSWASVPSGSFSASVPLATSGSNTVKIEVKDPAGNVGTVTLTGWKL